MSVFGGTRVLNLDFARLQNLTPGGGLDQNAVSTMQVALSDDRSIPDAGWKEQRSHFSEYLGRCIQTAVKPRVREKTGQDHEDILRWYIRPTPGERVLAGMRTPDLQIMCQRMSERGLSARTYGVEFAVSVDDLRIEPGPDGFSQVEIILTAYNREGEPLNLVVASSEIRIRSKDYANLQQSGLKIDKEIDVPQCDMFLRAGIYDLRSAGAGTLGVPV